MSGGSCIDLFAEIDLQSAPPNADQRGRLLRQDNSEPPPSGRETPSEQNARTARNLAISEERARRLEQWENEPASPLAPAVASSEKLRRTLRANRDLVNGELVRQAFSDLEKLGLSTDRCDYADVEFSHARAASRGDATAGYLELDVETLRKLCFLKKDDCVVLRAIGVFGTALPDNKAHAEAFFIRRHSGSVPMKGVMLDLQELYAGCCRPWPAKAA